MQTLNLILTGFRATGKTSVGRIVAAQLHWIFLDTDELARQRLGEPIAEVVARHGWPFFRAAESQLLRDLATMRQTVLATGGGAIEHLREWGGLRRCALVVWLDADSDTIRQRLRHDPASGHQRPSLTGQPVADEIEHLLERRRPMYAAGSDLRLSTEGRTPEQLAAEIVQKMHNL
ncbi:MAG: shikimate kinase [Desulfobulbus sp.]|jgi:shikimate kinase|uniref:shikimate kinase n=1 Tax=Desulfobulbus sp. TaxID=895 RepID=UPI00283F88E7|nr:shikimate kinase [Desulfobulbus sp.]MDR2551511.1 shikimate kinase [Desulfobulbus sp.]